MVGLMFNSTDHYYNEILQHHTDLPGQQLAWLTQLRHNALENFQKMGFPTTQVEEWKYTNVENFTKKPFKIATKPSHKISQEQIQGFLIQGLESYYLVFVDGVFDQGLSKTPVLAKQIIIENLSSALQKESQNIAPYLASITQQKSHGFTALNSAHINDGAYIKVLKNSVVEQPIQLLFIHTGNTLSILNQPRNLIVLDEFAQATLIETYASLDDTVEYFTNAVTEIVIAPQAKLDYVKIQQDGKQGFHIGTTFAQLQRDSQFIALSLALGGKLVRSDVSVSLADTGAYSELNGLYLAQHKQHIDHHTVVEHLKPHGTSREFYRGIIADQARAVFNGKIFVEKDAQQTDAQQENHNLLLSHDAEIDTKPQLEIYANEVKCAHGATVGQLDEEALFYLQSRGVPKAMARNLLIYAFGVSVLDKIKNEMMRAHLQKILLSYLPGEVADFTQG